MAVIGSATVTLTQYRDIQSVTRYYKLQIVGSSAPSKPTTKPPSSDWTDSEPACDISKELYFCDLTIFSNGEWEYSKVSKSTSYEAAKEAYNKADNAQTTANTAKTDAATAQSTADTAKANAATAQSTASNAQTKAEQALKASSVTTETLKAESARIDNLESTKADITSLNAGIARIDTLEAGKANIDLANVNNAWITNGVIKDASIANEKVISVSANKLTAGTIDASKITVTNLNADNITVGTINGARIGDSSIDLGKLSQEVPTKEYLDSVEQKLQGEIDGAIETFTVSQIPTLNNEPAVNWTTDDIKSTHIGDLCYVVNNASDNDGFCYRFQYNGTVYSWALIKDNDVTKAIQDIAELDGKVTQFKTDYTSKVSEIDGGIESLKSRTTTIETTYSTKTYTDNKASDALTSANSYADNKATSTLTSAKSYTDSTASNTLGEAKSYTDTATADMATTGDIPTKVSELTNDSSFATTTQVSTAKSEAISTASADATSKANSALDSAKSYTDAVEIGGRNLILNSAELYCSGLGSVDGSRNEYQYINVGQSYMDVENGTKVVLSFDLEMTVNTANPRLLTYNTNRLGPKQIMAVNLSFTASAGSTIKERCTIETNIVDRVDATLSDNYIEFYTDYETSNWFKITNLKLEKGNKATDWTPAPEDVDAGIANAQTAADSVASAAANAQTTADTAKTNAATAQSTADTAKANAATAQTAADNAQTTADEAKAKAEAAQTAVSTKVETSVFNTLKNTVDENSANITSLTETVTTKADSSTVTTLSNTVNEVKQTADANSSSISNLTTTVNSKADGSKVTALENKTSTIEQNLSGVTTRVTNLESTSDGLDTRLTSAESKITDDAIVSTVTSSKTYKDALSGKVDTSVYNTKMQQLDDSISLKATATDVYTKTQADSAFDAKGSAATAKSDAISSAKSYTDTATTDMATKEYVTSQGYLTVTSDAITSKVSKNEVISAINQTAESVSIDAEKINLRGAITFSSFDNSLQTTINNKAETSDLEDVRTVATNAKTSIDNLEIGGRNLILKSETKPLSKYEDAITTQTGITVSEWNTNNAIRSYGVCNSNKIFGTLATGSSSPASAAGQAYVHSIYVKNNGETPIIISNNGIGGSRTIQPGESTRVILHGTGDNARYLQFVFFSSNLGDALDVTYWHPKIEIGDKATDWTPAPEDVDEGIKNAATVATNFMSYNDTDGLIVGNKTGGSFVGSRAQVLPDSFNILDTDGTKLASFGETTVIGDTNKANLYLTYNELYMEDKDDKVFFKVGDYRNSTGVATLTYTDTRSVEVSAGRVYVALSIPAKIESVISVVVEGTTISKDNYRFSIIDEKLNGEVVDHTTSMWVEGLTYGEGDKVEVEVTYTTKSPYSYYVFGLPDKSLIPGRFSSSEGWCTRASGEYTHAEGRRSIASGYASHAEGSSYAYGYMSHAEGTSTANGTYSHAEGSSTTGKNAKFSHAEGDNTVAGSESQHVSGAFNIIDNDGKYAFIIGNGSSFNSRSNAMTVDWNGVPTFYGMAGEIKMWAGDTIPNGWLLCDGSEISKTDYPNLYAAIGDLWGTPNSSSNFKLPNLTGRVPVGYNSADTDTTETFGKVGATGGARGAWYHTHTIGSSGAHHHATQGRTEGSGTGANIFESYNGASKTRSVNVPRTGDNGAHTHSPGSSGSSGNKLAADKANMPPYAVVKYIICAI